MAIVQNPITGRTKGSFANVTFYTRFGKNVMKSKSLGTSMPATASQLLQRVRFKNAVKFFKMNMALLAIHYQSFAVNMSSFNAFMKQNISLFSNVLNTPLTTAAVNLKFSTGNLDSIVPVSCVAATLLKVNINATLIPDTTKSKTTDLVCILLFNRTTQIVTKFEILRSAWTALNSFTTTFSAGTIVDCFALTHDSNAYLHSTSVFLGTVTIMA